jgi:hypothetical protein
MTKGIVAKVTTELVLNDINLAGIVECAPELTLVVADRDAPRALEALQKMLNEDAPKAKATSLPFSSINTSNRAVIHASAYSSN